MRVHDINTTTLLSAVIATGAGTQYQGKSGVKTFQAKGTTTAGAGSATIKVQGSLNGTDWDDLGTITLTLATTTSSGSFTSDDRYSLIRGNVTTISGTNAAVSLYMGY